MLNPRMQEARNFAERITHMGFTVYLAEPGPYGFITDETESRVLSFSFNDMTSLGGNYGRLPPKVEQVGGSVSAPAI